MCEACKQACKKNPDCLQRLNTGSASYKLSSMPQVLAVIRRNHVSQTSLGRISWLNPLYVGDVKFVPQAAVDYGNRHYWEYSFRGDAAGSWVVTNDLKPSSQSIHVDLLELANTQPYITFFIQEKTGSTSAYLTSPLKNVQPPASGALPRLRRSRKNAKAAPRLIWILINL